MKEETNRQEECRAILEKAKELGLESNFFFKTTFERYIVQIKIMDRLAASIEEYGPTVTKEYVKGRENLVANPAICEYNKTSTAANGTVSTLLKILASVAGEKITPADLMREFINS